MTDRTKRLRLLALAASHAVFLGAGFALGIYALPILTAPQAPTMAEAATAAGQAAFTGRFRRDLEDSDLFHWGEGSLSVGPKSIVLVGKLAPGPDYKLYLSPEFVETEADFARLKPRMVRVGDVRTFENFVVPVPETVDVARYTTAIVWCESFGQFITAAKYRPGAGAALRDEASPGVAAGGTKRRPVLALQPFSCPDRRSSKSFRSLAISRR